MKLRKSRKRLIFFAIPIALIIGVVLMFVFVPFYQFDLPGWLGEVILWVAVIGLFGCVYVLWVHLARRGGFLVFNQDGQRLGGVIAFRLAGRSGHLNLEVMRDNLIANKYNELDEGIFYHDPPFLTLDYSTHIIALTLDQFSSMGVEEIVRKVREVEDNSHGIVLNISIRDVYEQDIEEMKERRKEAKRLKIDEGRVIAYDALFCTREQVLYIDPSIFGKSFDETPIASRVKKMITALAKRKNV